MPPSTSTGTWSPTAAFTLGSCTSAQSQWLSKLAALHDRQSEQQDLVVRSGGHHVKCCSAVVQLAATVVGHHNACSPCIHCQARILRGHHALHQQEASVKVRPVLGCPCQCKGGSSSTSTGSCCAHLDKNRQTSHCPHPAQEVPGQTVVHIGTAAGELSAYSLNSGSLINQEVSSQNTQCQHSSRGSGFRSAACCRA